MGERLQRLRRAAGLSQQQLADRARVPLGSLRNWEQGRRTPLLDAAGRVAVALGISLDDLAGITRPPTEGQADAPPPAEPPPAPKGRKRRGRAEG
jgi:transcriptional regulator with XRE-family HTH domain